MELSNFQEVITFAIRKEADAATLYETYASKVSNPGIKKMFEELMKEELGHKKILENITEQKVEDYKLTAVPDLKISDYSQEQEFKPDMNFQEALLLAIKREENSLNLYNNLVKSTGNPQLQKLFQTLSQEEAKHKLRLETEYDEHVYKWD
jgi:rubrerythrin